MSNADPFASVVSQVKEAASVDLSGDWKPDPGQYTVALTDVDSGISQQSSIPYVRATFQILDGDLKGRSFTDSFFCDANQKGQMGIRSLALAAACIAGSEIPQAGKSTGQYTIECRNVLQTNKGAVLVLELSKQKNKKHVPGKNKEFYDRINYARRIPAATT